MHAWRWTAFVLAALASGAAGWFAASRPPTPIALRAPPAQIATAPTSAEPVASFQHAGGERLAAGLSPITSPAAIEVQTISNASKDDEVRQLQTEVARLQRELDYCQFAEGTPWGAFLRSPEAASIDTERRKHLKNVLDNFPVILLPGEATWIATYEGEVDYLQELVDYLGSNRILRALTPAQTAYLKSRYPDGEFERLMHLPSPTEDMAGVK